MYIAVDFDGTIVEHRFPHIGPPVPGALEWLLTFQTLGAKLILNTIRDSGRPQKAGGDVLAPALTYLKANHIKLFGMNENPDQKAWSKSPKVYAHIYIDDAAYGCPLVYVDARPPYADWSKIGPAVLEMISTESWKGKTNDVRWG